MSQEWPWQYDFPPFFTLQPNPATRAKQLELWARIVLDFCEKRKIYNLDLTEARKSELFHNANINRKLSADGVSAVFDCLATSGHVTWKIKGQSCRVLWRKPEEWGNLIYNWAFENGLKNSVVTLFSIIHDDDTKGESFHGLDEKILTEALQSLQRSGKAEIIGDEGVKFF